MTNGQTNLPLLDLRGDHSDTGFSSIPMLTYGESLPHVYSLHNSFIQNLFLASERSVLVTEVLVFPNLFYSILSVYKIIVKFQNFV